jgi:hypothetical protein
VRPREQRNCSRPSQDRPDPLTKWRW